MLRSSLALAAFVFAASVLAPNTASALEQPRQVRVSYADLDLTSRADLDRLYVRLERAADNACEVDIHSVIYPHVRECRDDTLDNAIASVGSEALTALHAERTGAQTQIASR